MSDDRLLPFCGVLLLPFGISSSWDAAIGEGGGFSAAGAGAAAGSGGTTGEGSASSVACAAVLPPQLCIGIEVSAT